MNKKAKEKNDDEEQGLNEFADMTAKEFMDYFKFSAQEKSFEELSKEEDEGQGNDEDDEEHLLLAQSGT